MEGQDTEKLGWRPTAQEGLTLMLAAFAILPTAAGPTCESSPPHPESRGRALPEDGGSQGWPAWRREEESPHRVRIEKTTA